VNILVLWNTLYIDRVLTQLRAPAAVVNDEDVERFSPLGSNHFNFLGRCHSRCLSRSPAAGSVLSLPEPVARGGFRPLPDPSDAEDDLTQASSTSCSPGLNTGFLCR
jgi:Tn3 transposase DDE domain